MTSQTCTRFDEEFHLDKGQNTIKAVLVRQNATKRWWIRAVRPDTEFNAVNSLRRALGT